jgi:putative GTP pyrophosphokinase
VNQENMNPSQWTDDYRDVRPKYESLTRKVTSLLEALFEREDIKSVVESRTKDIESFHGKITRPNKSYSNPLVEITDLSGIRVILYSLSDVERVASLIEREFIIDGDKSVNKSDQLDADRFGYLSQHYIVRVSESRRDLIEWSAISDLFAEIQVRTTLQHAWASVEHFLVYKNEMDAPRLLRRRLFRLSALFELADAELDQLITDRISQTAEYKKELNEGNVHIEINVDSLKAYIQDSSEPKYWRHYIRENLGINVPEEDFSDLSRDVRFAHFFGLAKIDEINQLLIDAHGWGETFFLKYFGLETRNVAANKITLVTNGSVVMLMIASNAERISQQVMETEFGWGDAEKLLAIAKDSRQNTI